MKQIAKKDEYKREVMTLFAVAGARVRNDDVQALLSVSDATATRYLTELEEEKLIKQVGDFGKYVWYEKR